MENNDNGETDLFSGRIMVGSPSPSRSLPQVSSPPSTAVGVGVYGGVNYILHTVSKFDTLAGVAIKYGVEVADIKRLNGLVTDIQMFALKTLQIPLPGRHPPSPILSNGHDTPQRPSSSEKTPSLRRHSDFFDSFQSLKLNSSERKVSPAMSTLQGYYCLRPDPSSTSEGFEMTVYRNGGAYDLENGLFTKTSSNSAPPPSHHRKSRTVLDLASHNGDLNLHVSLEAQNDDTDSRWIDKLLRRRQKSEADFTSRAPEKLLKEESSTWSAISAITGQQLALRPKSACKTVDGEASGLNPSPLVLGESSVTNWFSGVRKSSSTSSLHETDNGTLSSIWPTSRWNSKPDFQALSKAAIARPIFDGLPKPTGRRNKAALD